METTAIEKARSFEERMKTRIKEGIGDLLSDEEVKKLIDRGMEEVFLKPTKIKDPRNSYNTIDGPCLLHDIVAKELQPIVTKCVSDYLADHKEEVIEAANKAIEGGMAKAMTVALDGFFSNTLMNLRNNVMNEVASKIQRQY
jgi:hypothetical protein